MHSRRGAELTWGRKEFVKHGFTIRVLKNIVEERKVGSFFGRDSIEFNGVYLSLYFIYLY